MVDKNSRKTSVQHIHLRFTAPDLRADNGQVIQVIVSGVRLGTSNAICGEFGSLNVGVNRRLYDRSALWAQGAPRFQPLMENHRSYNFGSMNAMSGSLC
jgi:hypothetical protein